ncbi:glycosyl hydrolase [Rhexocercosporidium sp. MPI-PUGE-AT-0058]|nr:glycosyl hydrolase [Rhexocercosporidium sp. MPI-PUGE-AT-0058]
MLQESFRIQNTGDILTMVKYLAMFPVRTVTLLSALLLGSSEMITAQINNFNATSNGTYPIYSSNSVPEVTEDSTENETNYTAPYFPLLGFTEYEKNPILAPNPANNWESAYLYNPSAIVIDDKVWLLYRAQNSSKTSTIGLAWSEDGYNFTRYNQPVLTPTEWYEIPGGCEDPRVIRVNGTFYMTYTAYDGTTARLCLATSTDLVEWTKYGPMLPNVTDVLWNWQDPLNSWVPRQGWSKSGAILNERQPDGTYHMHFGDSFLYFANSTDLIHWNVSYNQPVYAPKLNVWEQALMESASPPVKTRDGKWLKIYNGVATGQGGFKATQYSTGQMLIDPVNLPYGPPLARLETPLLQPTNVREINGQVDNVVFSEGLVQFRGKWFLYFGEGDAFLGVATTPVQP